MLHAILSILVGALGGLSARVIFSFAASVVLLPLSLFSSRRETQVSTVQAALALCLLVIAVSLYDFAVIKSWKGIVEHLTWGDYIGIVVFCVSSACIPDSRAADMAGDCKYNSMILNAGVYFSLFIPVGFLLMDCSENMWSYLSFIIVFLLFSFFLIDFHCSKKSMKQIFADGNNYPEIEIEKKRWAGRKWRMIAIIISVCFLTAFSVVQLFNGKKYAHENETVELDHTRLMDLGEQYLNKGDVERAVSCFKKSAEFGNAKAQRRLGYFYFWVGVTQNDAMWADIQIENQTFRVISCHLQTTNFSQKRKELVPSELYNNDLNQIHSTFRDVLSTLEKNFKIRAQQADLIRHVIDTTTYPVIVCGDFNDTPASYTYHRIKGDLTDGFRKCGNGYGYTFRGLRNLLRIDFILYSAPFYGLQYQSPDLPWSDHKPVLMELEIKPTH